MMFRLEKTFTFEAAHQLVGHDGRCARKHGHSWRGTIICEAENLIESGPKKGMVVDYGDMKAAIQPIIDNRLDHYDLNVTLFPLVTTSENIARWLYQELKPTLPSLIAVVIEETCTSRCTYFGPLIENKE